MVREIWTEVIDKSDFSVADHSYAHCTKFDNRDDANRFFERHRGEPMITRNGDTIKYWSSCREDWLLPMIYAEETGTDWETSVVFEVLHSVYSEEFERIPNGEDSFSVMICGESFCVAGEFIKEDEQLADMMGMKDKYMRYSFWNDNNDELSSFCIEV